MREVSAAEITESVKRLCIEANCRLPADMKARIAACCAAEPWPQGKLLLSQLPDSEVLRRTQGTMQAFTPHTITEPQKLLQALHTIREDGYAVEDGEYKIGLRSVSAPVWDRYGHPQYALGVVGLFRRVASPEFQDTIHRVTETATQLSELLKNGM